MEIMLLFLHFYLEFGVNTRYHN